MCNTAIQGSDVELPDHMRPQMNPNGFSDVWRVRATTVNQDKADTLIFSCMDFRFGRCQRLFVTEQMGISSFDTITVPGADRIFSAGATTPEAAMVKRFIDKSIELHSINGIIIFGHWNCGGHPKYDCCDTEAQGHEQALLESLEYLRGQYSKLKLTGVYSRLFGKQMVFYKKKL